MRRSLVLTDESARHPFRASLPPFWQEERSDDEIEQRVPWWLKLGLTRDDMRGFMANYCAGVVAVSIFLA